MGSGDDEDGHDDDPADDFDDSQADDDLGSLGGSPPHPRDRAWFHPSELASIPQPTSPSPVRTTSRRSPAVWAVPVASGAVGALVAVVVLAAIGALDRGPADSDDNRSAALSNVGAVNVSAPVRGISESVVAIAARDENGMRRGSAVCLQKRGEVLASAQVVGAATTVELTTSDGVQHSARVVGTDAVTGLALLAVDTPLKVAPVELRTPNVGAAVRILGASPGSDTPWVSDGVVASTDAILALAAGPTTSGLLETDAVVNAGAAGGALVDAKAVLGIVLAPVDGTRTSFAMRVDAALEVADSLRAHGVAPHGSLGLEGIDGVDGPTIVAAPDGGTAARVGLHAGDILRSVAGRQVDSMIDVMAIVRGLAPGATVQVVVRRGQRTVKLSVPVGSTMTATTTSTTPTTPATAVTAATVSTEG